MVGLPVDLSEGDILGEFSFFESQAGPQLLNPKKVDNIYSRISKLA